ncbi:MAG: lipoprotein signal peptidase [Bacteroides sp.]|nr:lipoprotein signal peptidase [Bacteroides sp.]MCM1086182.1 lipoprotein signal peptidase [Bacteroides sp.]
MKKFAAWCGRHLPVCVVVLVLLVDQASKFWIKLSMRIGDEIDVFGWFKIHFLENEGMAFGFSFGGNGGKLLLSLIRLAAIVFLVWYLAKINRKRNLALAETPLSKKERRTGGGLIVSLSLILAGAIGNMIDSAFYGLIFSDSYFHVAQLFPAGGGYASFLHGRVVDMLYFPLVHGFWPSWMPWVGGHELLFFRPVFNIADSAITVGFVVFFITQRDFWFPKKKSPSVS